MRSRPPAARWSRSPDYADLGMEAVWRIEVANFPAFIVIDDKGNDFFRELNLG
jgi:fumarate hydratase class I